MSFRNTLINLQRCDGPLPLQEPFHVVDVISSLNPARSYYASNHIIRVNQHLQANCVPGTHSFPTEESKGGITPQREPWTTSA